MPGMHVRTYRPCQSATEVSLSASADDHTMYCLSARDHEAGSYENPYFRKRYEEIGSSVEATPGDHDQLVAAEAA